jgi:two-component system, OmpR family, response regulator CpxR
MQPWGESRRGAVLSVEDEAALQEVVREVLEDEGYRVFCARDGRAALALLREIEPPALILLDLMMPDMNGWEFLRHLRDSESLSAIPVVVLSACNGGADAATLPKPFGLEDLLAIVKRYCG